MERIKNTFRIIRDTVPNGNWMKYASLRLGTFIMSYFATVAVIVICFALSGIALSFGAVIGIIPLAVFFAIRLSGALTEKAKEKLQ